MALRGFTIFNFFLVKFKNGPPDAVIKIFSICDVLNPLLSEYIEKCSESIGTKDVLFFFNCLSIAVEKPFHHLPDGTFRNPEGSPERDSSFNWSFKIFNEEKKKIKIKIPDEHVIKKQIVLDDINKHNKIKIDTTTATKPVRPPAAIPVALSK